MPRQPPGTPGPAAAKPRKVEVTGLTKRFSGFTAVNGVRFSVQEGEIFGFLGPNGSGKTTTIRMLCGLMTPTAGSARVLGLDVAPQPEKVKARIGVLWGQVTPLTVFSLGVVGISVAAFHKRLE